MNARRLMLASALAATLALTSAPALAADTAVPGHQGDRYDADGNGYSDAGVYVNGHYTSIYAYDANGAWYWDLGDGRVQGNVGSVDELDAQTRTTCTYQNTYRADFGNDAFMNTGWIHNNINCVGVDQGVYKYLFVHADDPRYSGDGLAVWGTWEYHVLAQSGMGNTANPMHPDFGM